MLNMKAHDSPSCMTESSVDTDVPAGTSLYFIENQTYFIISTQDQTAWEEGTHIWFIFLLWHHSWALVRDSNTY